MSERARKVGGGPLLWLGALLAIYLIAPVAAFFIRLRHGAPSAPGLGGALVTSLITATISAAIIAVLGIPLAYLLARARGRIGAALSVLVALPLALPPLMSGILLLYLVGPYTALGRLFNGNLTDTRAGIVLAQTFVAAPFLVIAARGAFAAVDPALEDVARTLGHRRVAVFAKMALPAAWPGVQAGLMLGWLRAFGEFGATVILAYHPYSLPVFTFVQFDSTGLPSTVVPVVAALGAALVVLAAVQLHGRRRRPRAVLPTPTAPRLQPAAPLRFELQKRLGDSFRLALHHDAASPRLALLGPSGSGKSLTLRLLAGITGADRAEISAGTLDLARLGAEQRNLGYLPQHSALLPRRTVWQQVNFAVDADPALAAWWLDRLGLTGLHDRFPDELSGGQQRRVALVRALARAPSLILLDEPFSALDAPVRARLYRELRRLQHETGLATVLVTHDPEEAALLADEVIVLDDGVAVQQGTIADVFAHPASPTVAALLGIPNTHAGRILGPGRLRSGALELAAPTGELTSGRVITWTIRPEAIGLVSDQADPESGAERGPGDGHPATVVDAVTVGAVQEVTVALDGLELIARTLPSAPWRPGDPCRVNLPPEAITVWPSDNGSWPVDDGTWHVGADAAGRR